jgi:hypothetical protein
MTTDLTQGDVLAGHASAIHQNADVIERDPAAAMHEQPKGDPQ